MEDEKKKYIEMLKYDRELRLQALREEHRINLAVFKSKEEMLLKDIRTFEEGLAINNKR